eukprot:Hpha_TRINITY_DN16076_c1_g6::TRINITY_DN16076_c1_g6_i1::g.119163::m.119163/K03094/SKP1, CBF3D; S-phase kinase-associated protein 1
MADEITSQVYLLTTDGKRLAVNKKACQLSGVLQGKVDEWKMEGKPLEVEVDAEEEPMLKVIEWMHAHEEEAPPELEKPLKTTLFEVIGQFDQKYLQSFSDPLLVVTLKAAGQLDAPDLFALLCARAAEFIKERSPAAVREMLGIENDISPEDEVDLRKRHGIEPEAEPPKK